MALLSLLLLLLLLSLLLSQFSLLSLFSWLLIFPTATQKVSLPRDGLLKLRQAIKKRHRLVKRPMQNR